MLKYRWLGFELTNWWSAAAVIAPLCGALVGWLVHGNVFTGYRATIAFGLQSEMALYRKSEELLRSVDWFREFSQAYKTEPTSSAVMERQLALGNTKPVSFELAFRVSRSDLRDLPEPAVKELAPSLIKDGRFDLVTIVKEDNPEVAVRLAELAIRYARHVLFRVTLTDWIPPWRAQVSREQVDIQAAILSDRASLSSISRRIDDLERLREKFKEIATVNPQIAGVQVQVSGPRYLSIVQQLVGLESERIDLTENLRQTEASLPKIEALNRLVARFEEIFKAEPNAEQAVRQMEAVVLDELKKSDAAATPLAERLAIVTVWKSVAGHRDRFIDGLFSPPTAVVRREAPLRSLFTFGGALLGLIGWLLSYRLIHRSNDINP